MTLSLEDTRLEQDFNKTNKWKNRLFTFSNITRGNIKNIYILSLYK